MKILLISDKECNILCEKIKEEEFKNVDCIISCGDLKSSYLSYLVTMIKGPLFYVHGNHDDNYIKNPPDGCESIEDRIINFKGIKIMGIGGSRKYKEGAFQFTDKEMDKRIKKMKLKLLFNKELDVLVTHSPAFGLGDGEDFCHIGFKGYNELIDKYSPKYHFHGHQHLDYGTDERIIKCNNTTIINGYGYHLLEY